MFGGLREAPDWSRGHAGSPTALGRITSLPERSEAAGEFTGWIDADHICFDCDVLKAITAGSGA